MVMGSHKFEKKFLTPFRTGCGITLAYPLAIGLRNTRSDSRLKVNIDRLIFSKGSLAAWPGDVVAHPVANTTANTSKNFTVHLKAVFIG
jgi:hypothetical protein